MRREQTEQLTAAWVGEWLHRVKRLPSLRSILPAPEPRRRREMTAGEFTSAMRMWAANNNAAEAAARGGSG